MTSKGSGGSPNRDKPEAAAHSRDAASTAARPSTTFADLRILENAHDLTVASVRGALILVWHNKPTVEAVRRVDGYLSQTRATQSRFAIVVVVSPGNTQFPDAAARQALADLSKKYDTVLAGAAIVLESSHPTLMLIRLSLTTIRLLSSKLMPRPVFASVEAACHWVASQQPGVDENELASIVARVRALSRE